MKIRYSHQCFLDTAYSLMHEYRTDTSNTLCILGAKDLCKMYQYDEITTGYDHVIVYNQEPMFCSHTPDLMMDREEWLLDEAPMYYEWLSRADEVWDYDENNIAYLKPLGINARLHILKPYMDWALYALREKDIDILFIGSLDKIARRETVIDFLKRKYNVVTIDETNKIYGDMIDSYILRSKILLNVHGLSTMQEQARMIKWIGAPCEIVSEKSAHNYLGVPEKEYWELFLL